MGSWPSAVAELHGNSGGFYLKVPALHKAFVLNGVNGSSEMAVITSSPDIVKLYYADYSALSGSLSTAHKFIGNEYTMVFYKPGTLDMVASSLTICNRPSVEEL
ncbi:unnamed protein product [Rhizoctonia solani]|uniref:Uncharacterized protein n=1 Tax=Rhizoctonia solani TaxID=456999 RepID=A0A8H3C7Q5_9AGAM|nr:unnamed protein product [Rhizoctonia solani]